MNALLIAGFAAAAFVATARGLAWACASAGDRLGGAAGRSTSLRAILTLLPVAVASALTVSLLSPEVFFGRCHCVTHPHHLHLCFEHGGFSWVLVLTFLVAVAGLVASGGSFAQLISDHIKAHRWVTSARYRSAPRDGEIRLVEGASFAACAGVLRPRILIGATLWSALDEPGRSAIAAHERAHVERGDPLTLFVLRFAACLMGDAGARLVAAWRGAAELAADRRAAAAVGDPTIVAEALLACARLQQGEAAPPMVLAATQDTLETRVLQLLAQPERARPERGRDLFRALVTALVVATALAALGGHSAHHAVETVLGLVA